MVNKKISTSALLPLSTIARKKMVNVKLSVGGFEPPTPRFLSVFSSTFVSALIFL